jgi:ATP-binding cassette subfamily F protein 3
MISTDNLTKSYAGQSLFEDASFKINAKERVGLVGRNGHGKTTLFRLITGEEKPDSGTIIIPKHYHVGYVRQHLGFTEDTILKEGIKGLPSKEEHHYWKVEKILSGLGFTSTDMQRHPAEFSGGFQVRLNLAKILVSEPDMLLLDEPTNYLDITSIRWIEQFLLSWQHELMLITHDRSFMDRIVTHTLGIHRKKMRKIPGNTEKYYAQIAQDEEIHEKTRVNDERKQKDIELFISRFRAKARLANMVQSRVKTLEKMDKNSKLEKIKALEFSFQEKPFNSKYLLNAGNLSFSYTPENPLIKNLDISIAKGDRICVIGKNGKGKTTLLKLLTGDLTPETGTITYNPNTEKSFFEQTNIKNLVDSRTVEEEILYSHSHVDSQLARNISGAMMFQGDHALKKISVLSGGEKSRVMLGKILVTPVNLLLLDEPTNHLDMESCDALLAAIDNFDGAVVMVTHNEMFLHALAERLIIFQKDGITVFEDTYQNFLDKVGWEDEDLGPRSTQKNTAIEKLSKKELRKKRSEIISERSTILKPLEKRIKAIEDEIEKNEGTLNNATSKMQEATQKGNGEKIAELSSIIHNSQSSIDTLFEELEDLTEKFEIKKQELDSKLAELNEIVKT